MFLPIAMIGVVVAAGGTLAGYRPAIWIGLALVVADQYFI